MTKHTLREDLMLVQMSGGEPGTPGDVAEAKKYHFVIDDMEEE